MNNYELQSKIEKILQRKFALSSEKLNRYPTIDLNVQMARGSSESTFFVDSETKSNSVGLTFFLPLYTKEVVLIQKFDSQHRT